VVAPAVTVNESGLVAVPLGVATEIVPDVAPAGTVVLICVGESTLNVVGVPLNRTAVAPVNPVPVAVTDVPTGPLSGRNDRRSGAAPGVTVKGSGLALVPSESVTEIAPVVAPTGTVAVIWSVESTVNAVDVPLNLTAVAVLVSSKESPVIVTDVPTVPLSGTNARTVGGSACAGTRPMVAMPTETITTTVAMRYRRSRPDLSIDPLLLHEGVDPGRSAWLSGQSFVAVRPPVSGRGYRTRQRQS
jgi:hypothetical protein